VFLAEEVSASAARDEMQMENEGKKIIKIKH
jgi:hypothetical protein